MYIRWLIFFLSFMQFVSSVDFLNMWLWNIVAITSSNGQSAYP